MVSIAEDVARRQLAQLRDQFEQMFEDESELAQLSNAARRVLAVAAALFFQQGSEATSVRQLTKACGLTPGALYNHFGSRDELLFTLVQTGHVRAQRDLDAAVADDLVDARVALTRFVRAYTEIHLRLPAFAQLIHREYVHLSVARRAEIVARRRRMRDQLVAILRAGAQDGVFNLVGDSNAEVGTAMMVLDMCSRTSEWFNPGQHSPTFSDRYAAAALRLAGVRD